MSQEENHEIQEARAGYSAARGTANLVTIAVQEKFAEILTTFGDLQESANTALQRYAIEQITTKIHELRRRNASYQARYGLNYLAFSQRMMEDEAYVQQIEANVSKTWELDLADWEFCFNGMADWTKK